jgi:hypothetical protein
VRTLTLDARHGTIGYDAQNPGAKKHLAVDIVQGPLVVFGIGAPARNRRRRGLPRDPGNVCASAG